MATLGEFLTASYLLEKSRRRQNLCAVNGRYVETFRSVLKAWLLPSPDNGRHSL
jgi:hypothetical protein